VRIDMSRTSTYFEAIVARSSSILAQTDHPNGNSRTWYLVAGLLMLVPIFALSLFWYVAAKRAARAKRITDALARLDRITLFELSGRLNRSDLDALWSELRDLHRSGQLMGFRIDEEGRFLERPIPPDPWTCSACGASNDGRESPLRCASCDSPRPNCT
jgi:hypothetical protein